MGRSLLRYIFRILIAKLRPIGIRMLLWQNQRIYVRRNASEEQGAAFVNPATCFAKGLVEHQIIGISVTFQTWQNVTKRTSRMMRLRLSSSIPGNFVEIGRNDAFNMFGCEPNHDFVVDSMIPYHMLPKLHRTLASADTVRLAPLKQHGVELKEDLSEELKEVFKVPQIIYNNDTLCVPVTDPFTYEMSRYYFKVMKRLRQHRKLLQKSKIRKEITKFGAVPRFPFRNPVMETM